MKKYLLAISLLSAFSSYAQVPEDAIRYSWYPQNGTARNMAVGGVMGSLGGDITAAFVNPAGLGFFKTGEAVITPGLFLNQQKTNYRQFENSADKNGFAFGPTGVILGFGDRYNSNKSSAISFAINQTASFNNLTIVKGLNNLSSFSETFAEEFAKSGRSIDEVLNTNSIFPYTAAPGLYTYLIDTVSVGGNLQVKAAPEYILDARQALQQEMIQRTQGGLYELAVSFAQNTKDKWYLGATLGIPILYYKSNTTFTESDTSNNTFNKFKSFTYQDEFKTTGAGVNLKLGVIYRPQDYIRVGLAVHTPSLMFMTDRRSSSLQTQLESDSGTAESYDVQSNLFTNGEPGEARYIQTSPWRAILSASYVFRELENVKQQRAFISADVEYVNHRGSRFSSDNEVPTSEEEAYYKSLNQVVKQEFKGTFNFKVGGELKFNTIMGRLGFAYYGNPYKDSQLKASRTLLSTGLGYRHKGFFIDLTYVHSMMKDVQFPYRLEDRENTFASINQNRSNIIATFGVKF